MLNKKKIWETILQIYNLDNHIIMLHNKTKQGKNEDIILNICKEIENQTKNRKLKLCSP